MVCLRKLAPIPEISSVKTISSMDEEMIISFWPRGAMLSSVATNLVPSDTMSAPAAIAPAIACPLLIAPARMRVFFADDGPQLA